MLLLRHLLTIQCLVELIYCVSIDDFFAFKSGSQEQHKLHPNDDEYIKINVNSKIPYFNNKYDKIWVSTNGVLSFDHGVGQYTPDPFPLKGHLFLAAFWADVDTRCNQCGNVYYRQSTASTELTEATQQIIEVYPGLRSQFEAKLLFIATWDHVGYYSQKADKTNTFQAVIVTDEHRAFVIFNYLSNGIQWTFGDASVSKHAQAGFNKGDGVIYASINGSYSDDIINVWKASNIGIPGRFIYKIDEIEIKPPQTQATRNKLYVEGTQNRYVCSERFKVYDVIFNADGQLIHDIAKEGLVSFVNDEELVHQMQDRTGGKVCAVGPFKVGKTWLLKQLCDKQIPDDQVLKTRGVSIIFSSAEYGDVFACVDTEGEHRVDEYTLGKARKATDKFHQEVALSICDVVFIVIDGLTSYKREYVDNMLKRVAALSSALAHKKVYVVHNFKDFNDPKIVHSYIKDTILLAYSTEDVERIGGDGINSWAYYRHFWADDHRPSEHGPTEKLAVNHYIFARTNTTDGTAGKLWNTRSLARLRSFVENSGGSGSPLHVKKQVTDAFSKLLPKYYLATERCGDDQCEKTPSSDGDDVVNVFDPSTWMNWFDWRPRVGESADGYERQFEAKGDSDKGRESPYRAILEQDEFKTYRVILKNKDNYDFHAYNLTNDGSPLDGYSLGCHTAEYDSSLIIRCDVPGMDLIGPKDSLQVGKMQIKKQYINGKRTIVIKGIRAVHEDMRHKKFRNTEKSFSGPFRYDFETPDEYDDDVIKSEQQKYVSYEKGELRIQIPKET